MVLRVRKGEDYLRPYSFIQSEVKNLRYILSKHKFNFGGRQPSFQKILPREVLELQAENMYNERKYSGNVRKR